MYQIFVRTLAGRTVVLDVGSPEASIWAVSCRVADIDGVYTDKPGFGAVVAAK